MDRRSTNVKGFVHFGGDITSGVEHGIGLRLGSASTGSTVFLESISDDTNANLAIRAQGAGTISIGNSSNKVAIGGAASPFTVLTATVEFTPPALAASTSANSTYAVTGLTTNAVIFLTPAAPLSPAYTLTPRCSTANELTVAWGNSFGSTIGTGESTGRFRLIAFQF